MKNITSNPGPSILSFKFVSYIIALLAIPVLFTGCQTLKEIANLRNVDFDLGAVRNINLAGVQLDSIEDYKDIKALDIVKLTAAFARKDLPLSFQLEVEAENPASNQVAARLVSLDWTLFLEDRETISGVINDERTLNPGEPVVIPVSIELELMEFFDHNARDIVELAMALSGTGGASKSIMLKAKPSIDTIVGPLAYPDEITIVNTEVG
ncbi:MAG: hypothetical protein KTR29_15620 [Rhodothermaceae bacterium]|nr:hypothetical protein [Rhodothermaceae bacterium]